MIKRLWLLLLIAMLLSGAGCSAGNDNAALHKALEDIQQPLAVMDERYAIYENALNSAQAYMDVPSEGNLQAAKETCTEAIAKLAKLPTVKSTLTEADKADLVKLGLNVADYSVPFESEAYNRVDCMQNLAFILHYLDDAPNQSEELKRMVGLYIEVNAVFRQVDYLCLNELFCRFDGKGIESFKNDFLPSLKTLSADGLSWDTDSAALTAKAEKLMNDADDKFMAYAAFAGEQYQISLDLREKLIGVLEEAGYAAAEAEEIVSEGSFPDE